MKKEYIRNMIVSLGLWNLCVYLLQKAALTTQWIDVEPWMMTDLHTIWIGGNIVIAILMQIHITKEFRRDTTDDSGRVDALTHWPLTYTIPKIIVTILMAYLLLQGATWICQYWYSGDMRTYTSIYAYLTLGFRCIYVISALMGVAALTYRYALYKEPEDIDNA